MYIYRFRVLKSLGAGEVTEVESQTERVGSVTEAKVWEREKGSMEERERDLEAIGSAPTNSEAIEWDER